LNYRVKEYFSVCGGLPCPDVCDNPLGYKFSWAPLGSLNALKNNALYLGMNSNIIINRKWYNQIYCFRRFVIHS
jgi:hypothetical protein